MASEVSHARRAVLAELTLLVAYHGAQRQLEYAQAHPLHARKHHAAYLLLKQARFAEDKNPEPKDQPWCDCQVCSTWLARVQP